jgi:hypothetical protein
MNASNNIKMNTTDNIKMNATDNIKMNAIDNIKKKIYAPDIIESIMHDYFVNKLHFEFTERKYITFNCKQKIIIRLFKYSNYVIVSYNYFDDKNKQYDVNNVDSVLRFRLNSWHTNLITLKYTVNDSIDTFTNDVSIYTSQVKYS